MAPFLDDWQWAESPARCASTSNRPQKRWTGSLERSGADGDDAEFTGVAASCPRSRPPLPRHVAECIFIASVRRVGSQPPSDAQRQSMGRWARSRVAPDVIRPPTPAPRPPTRPTWGACKGPSCSCRNLAPVPAWRAPPPSEASAGARDVTGGRVSAEGGRRAGRHTTRSGLKNHLLLVSRRGTCFAAGAQPGYPGPWVEARPVLEGLGRCDEQGIGPRRRSLASGLAGDLGMRLRNPGAPWNLQELPVTCIEGAGGLSSKYPSDRLRRPSFRASGRTTQESPAGDLIACRPSR